MADACFLDERSLPSETVSSKNTKSRKKCDNCFSLKDNKMISSKHYNVGDASFTVNKKNEEQGESLKPQASVKLKTFCKKLRPWLLRWFSKTKRISNWNYLIVTYFAGLPFRDSQKAAKLKTCKKMFSRKLRTRNFCSFVHYMYLYFEQFKKKICPKLGNAAVSEFRKTFLGKIAVTFDQPPVLISGVPWSVGKHP